jgi:hypothetical protein
MPLIRCYVSNLLHAPRVFCQVSGREQGGSVERKVWALCFSRCAFLPTPPTGVALIGDHPALYGLFFHQPHQEFTFATTNDGGADVVLAHTRVLLFRSCFLFSRLQSSLLTLERSVDRTGSDCDQVS